MTITPLTKLQAVNRILAVIGEAPVTSLTDDFVDAQIAQERLDQESLLIQADGWHFNTDYEYTLTPDNNNNILIPASALSVFVPDYRKYIVRSNNGTRMLYDREEHSYTFTDTMDVTIVWGYEFEDLPEPLKHYLMIKVGRQFQDTTEGDGNLHQFTSADELRLRAAFLNYESNLAKYNLIQDSQTVFDIYGRYR